MEKENLGLRLLLVDDEDEFRQATSRTLNRRGFIVTEAADGREALEVLEQETPDVIILDLKMPGMGGIELLKRIREKQPLLPVIILTGHGNFDSAVAGIKLEVTDFIQKPIDVEILADRIKALLERGEGRILREPTIGELMAPPSLYPRVHDDESMISILRIIGDAYSKPIPEDYKWGQVRSALVYDRTGRFLGIVRFSDLLKLLIPSFLRDSPYSSFFTGMFLAQCKVVGKLDISGLVSDQVFVDIDAPLMEAVHLLVANKLINIPVLKDGELVGILRARDIILESAKSSKI